jgi:hypothetical protein
MRTSKKSIKTSQKTLIYKSKAAMSAFNDAQILDARKRRILTEYLFVFLPSDVTTTQDFPLLDGSTVLRLTAEKKSETNQLIIYGAYIVHLQHKGIIGNDAKKTEKNNKLVEKLKITSVYLSTINGLKKLFELVFNGSPH